MASFVEAQEGALDAVRAARGDIAAAVAAAVPRIEAGGRLIYVGAGTSGRLGLLDSVELYPTFSWPKEGSGALLAGGGGGGGGARGGDAAASRAHRIQGAFLVLDEGGHQLVDGIRIELRMVGIRRFRLGHGGCRGRAGYNTRE